MSRLALTLLAATMACTSTSSSACPSRLVVEIDTMSRSGVWDTTAAIHLLSAAGDCLPVHHMKTKFQDSTTSYRIPITATLMGTFSSDFAAYQYANESLIGTLRVEAMSTNAVVLRSDTIPYRFIPSTKEQRVTGGLDGLTPDEMRHVAKVRVGLVLK